MKKSELRRDKNPTKISPNLHFGQGRREEEEEPELLVLAVTGRKGKEGRNDFFIDVPPYQRRTLPTRKMRARRCINAASSKSSISLGRRKHFSWVRMGERGRASRQILMTFCVQPRRRRRRRRRTTRAGPLERNERRESLSFRPPVLSLFVYDGVAGKVLAQAGHISPTPSPGPSSATRWPVWLCRR